MNSAQHAHTRHALGRADLMRLYGEDGRVELLRAASQLVGYVEDTPLQAVEECIPQEAPCWKG